MISEIHLAAAERAIDNRPYGARCLLTSLPEHMRAERKANRLSAP